MLPLKKIVCPTDFSKPSVEGLRIGLELAEKFDAELIVLYVIEPPGWSGMGQGCWRDDDCRRNEYCHAGLCVTSPWLGRGAGTQVELGRPGDLDNPAVGPLSVAMQATGQIPRVPRGARVSQADVFPARRRAQNPGGGAYQEFVHPLG